MPIKLNPDRLRSEIDQVLEILKKQKELLEEGIPGDDGMPAREIDQEIFEMRLRSELMLAANRLTSIVEVLE